MAKQASGWKRKTARDKGTTSVRKGVTAVVPAKGGTALRVFAREKAAVAGGVNPALARLMFKREKPGPCDGDCACVFSEDNQYVWCESWGCDLERCECRLREMWKDKDGPHDEDRGYPGPEWKYRRKEGRYYRCLCKEKKKVEPIPDPTDNPT